MTPLLVLLGVAPVSTNLQLEKVTYVDQACPNFCAGIREELYIALHSENTDMRPALILAAAQHLESFVQVSPMLKHFQVVCVDLKCGFFPTSH